MLRVVQAKLVAPGRRAIRARSRSTTAMAANSAAAIALRLICQPGMPTVAAM